MESGKRRQFVATINKLKQILAAECLGVASSTADHQFYEFARRELLGEPELRSLLPQFLVDCHTLRDFWGYVHSHIGAIKHSMTHQPEKVEFVRKSFLPALDGLENDRVPVAQNSQTFLPPQSPHDGFVAVREVLARACGSVLIADNWVDATLLPLLTNVKSGSKVRILTVEHNLPRDFLAECAKFEKQYGISIEVRGTRELHDRFVISDASKCTHFGASLKDLGARAALISQVADDAISQAIVSALDVMWAKATVLR